MSCIHSIGKHHPPQTQLSSASSGQYDLSLLGPLDPSCTCRTSHIRHLAPYGIPRTFLWLAHVSQCSLCLFGSAYSSWWWPLFPFLTQLYMYNPSSWAATLRQVRLVRSRTALRFSQLVHLGDSLLELDVLAFLVTVSLVLAIPCVSVLSSLTSPQRARCSHRRIARRETYRALPRSVPRILPALVEGDQEVGAAVSVGEREAGFAHLLAGRFCGGKSAIEAGETGAGGHSSGRDIRRGSEAVSEAMLRVQLGFEL